MARLTKNTANIFVYFAPCCLDHLRPGVETEFLPLAATFIIRFQLKGFKVGRITTTHTLHPSHLERLELFKYFRRRPRPGVVAC